MRIFEKNVLRNDNCTQWREGGPPSAKQNEEELMKSREIILSKRGGGFE